MNEQRTTRRRRLPHALAVGAILWSVAAPGAPVSAHGDETEEAVMDWLDAFPSITVDHSAACMAGATDAVAYRNDRLVMRVDPLDNGAEAAVNTAANVLYGTAGTPIDYVGAIERITFPKPPSGPAFDHVLSISLLPRPNGEEHEVLRLARRVRSETGRHTSLDYVVSSSGHNSFYQPNGHPRWVAGPTPPRANTTPLDTLIGTGTKIEVYDTGRDPSNPGDLLNTTQLSPGDNELVNRVLNDGDPLMVDYPHAGHGKAITGVINTIAPGASVQHVRINERSGLATEVSATRGMASSLRTLKRTNYPDLIVNAFATAACDVDTAHPLAGVLQPIGLEVVVEVVDRFDPHLQDGMLIVASAGNMASTRPHYPAAFDTVVGVGALDGNIDSDGSPWSSPSKTAPVADFSNRGPWVDVYGLGVDLPTPHVDGVRFAHPNDPACDPADCIIDGFAEVDGSSFSAPKVTALIAELMSIGNLDARGALGALIAAGVAPLPQCGTATRPTGVAIVLPALAADITDPATAGEQTC